MRVDVRLLLVCLAILCFSAVVSFGILNAVFHFVSPLTYVVVTCALVLFTMLAPWIGFLIDMIRR